MKFRRRVELAEWTLNLCRDTGENVLVIGQGFKYKLFERLIVGIAELHYPGFLVYARWHPWIQLQMTGGGVIDCINLDKMDMQKATKQVKSKKYTKILFAEDVRGSLLDALKQVVVPAMEAGASLIPLEDNDV